MQMIGAGREAFHQKVQEPRETDAHGTAEPTECDALPQQVFHPRAPLIRNEVVVGRGTQLAFARFALMILLTMAGMALFLVPA